jgi:SPASM domain peptide maturase of grasp-with-spasm system
MSLEVPNFKLFANCIPVKGARRSIICDLQLRRYDFIPNGLYHILTTMKNQSVAEIKAVFDSSQHDTIDKYFGFLLEREYGFLCTEADLFPDLDLTWVSPEHITNAIVDVNEESNHPFESIFSQLDSLNCKALQLRFFSAVTLGDLQRILNLTLRGGLRHIDLLLRYCEGFSDEALLLVCSDHQRISRIVIHSSPESRSIAAPRKAVSISFTTQCIDSAACCGEVSPRYFSINSRHFSEAQTWNTCLNRKLSIAVDGSIRNCPSMPNSFGHVGTISLAAAMNVPGYKDMWSIAKDQIKICRDCEFRYICTDCRAYREDPDDIASKPLKCAYDPYTARWGEADERS